MSPQNLLPGEVILCFDYLCWCCIRLNIKITSKVNLVTMSKIMLISGCSGTGKTSTALQLCKLFKNPLYLTCSVLHNSTILLNKVPTIRKCLIEEVTIAELKQSDIIVIDECDFPKQAEEIAKDILRLYSNEKSFIVITQNNEYTNPPLCQLCKGKYNAAIVSTAAFIAL